MKVYAAFAVSLILSVLPNATAALVSLIFITGVLIAAYVIRKKDDDDGLCNNHMTFIIRTIWVGGFLAIVTVTAGSAYMLMHINNVPLNSCIDTFLAIDPAAAQTMSPAQLLELFNPCLPAFIETNKVTLTNSMVISAGPPLVYFLYRHIKGFARAIKGYRLANAKAWF